MAKPAVLTMISSVTTPTISNTFVNNTSEVCTLQISGTFSSATVNIEGIVNVNSGVWVTLATFNLSNLDLKTSGMTGDGIYQASVAGILRVRIHVTAVSGGNITVVANFVGATYNGKELPPSQEVPFTAYDYAVLGGYTGTETAYEQALANVVNVGPLAQQAAQSAQSAQNSANAAAASAADAESAAEEVTAEVVAEITTEWLDEHVDPVGSAVIVDNSLTISGAAADAKETGDQLADIKNVTAALFSLNTTPEIKVGRLGTTSGANDTILWCARTKTLTGIPDNVSTIRVSCVGYLIRLIMYANSNIGASNVALWYNSQYETGPIQYKIVDGANYYGINIRKSPADETALTNEDLEDIANKLQIYFNDGINKIQESIDEEISERKQSDDNILSYLTLNNTASNLNITVGRLGTGGGTNDTILWCARTNTLSPFANKPSLVSASCPGYYVRLFQYHNNWIGAGNIPVAFTNGYTENSITVPVDESARYYGINIRKNMDDSYTLTSEDLADISDKLVIKTNAEENNALVLDAKYGLGGVSVSPNPFYASEYSAEFIGEFGSSTTSTQGMCGDGHRYVWISGRKNNSDDVNCTIYKYDVIDKIIVKNVSEREYGHANDMAYVPDTNEIHILSWHTNDTTLYENGGTVDRISVIDADTLLFKYEYGLNDIIGTETGYYRLSAIAYNPGLRQFAGLLSAHEVNGESVRSLVRWSLTGTYIDHHDGIPTGTASGMDYDNNYIYLLLAYRLYYFDLQYNQIGNTTYRLPFAWSDGNEHIQEAESLSVFYDAVYMNTNNLHDPDSNPETRLYKLTPLTVQFLQPLADIKDDIDVMDDTLGYSVKTNGRYSAIIADNTDFDLITSAGEYRVANTSSAGTMNNIPVGRPGRLIVAGLTGAAKNIQFYASTYNQYFIRYFTSNSVWSAWEEIPHGFNKTDFDAALTQLTTLETDLNEIKDALNYTISYKPIVPSAGEGYGSSHFWNCEAGIGGQAVLDAYNNYYCYEPLAVNGGEKYRVTVTQGTSAKQDPVLIVDSSMNILQMFRGSSAVLQTFEVEVSPQGKYMLITTTTSGYSNTSISREEAVINCSGSGSYDFAGKNVAIIGDSISTNGHFDQSSNPFGNVPEIIVQTEDVGVSLSAYVTFRDVWENTDKTVATGLTIGGHMFTDSEIGTEVTFTPTSDDVGKMVGKSENRNNASMKVWWEHLVDVFGINPIPVCWSGSSITSHEGTKDLYKTSYAWHDAQIRKCGIRTPGTMNRTAPDIILIYRGTNDFSHTSYALLTDDYFDSATWDYPSTDVITGGYGYKEGLCLTVKKLRAAYPSAIIFLCTLNVFKRVNYSHFPTNNGTNTLPQYNNAIREVADFLGCGIIEFDKDGITFENCYIDGYITDSETTPTHPNDKGQLVMGNKAMRDLVSQANSMN